MKKDFKVLDYVYEIDIDLVKENPDNPRTITEKEFKKLKKNLQKFPEMLKKRPVVVVSDESGGFIVLGGNMRLQGLKRLKYDKIPVGIADNWTEEQKAEFVVLDNASFGKWDFDVLGNLYDIDQLSELGVEVPTIKNTELLSDLEYNPVYYEPINTPNIDLKKCIDFTKFNQKIKALEEFNLTQEQKETLKLFAYRFLKIDFESVANYYYFNASEEEQKAIERLRLVLVENGAEGFIQDDLLKITGITDTYIDF